MPRKNCRAKVNVSLVRIVQKHIRVIRFVSASFRKKEVYIFVHFDVDILEAEPAGQDNPALDPAAEIESPFARRREATSHVNRL